MESWPKPDVVTRGPEYRSLYIKYIIKIGIQLNFYTKNRNSFVLFSVGT